MSDNAKTKTTPKVLTAMLTYLKSLQNGISTNTKLLSIIDTAEVPKWSSPNVLDSTTPIARYVTEISIHFLAGDSHPVAIFNDGWIRKGCYSYLDVALKCGANSSLSGEGVTYYISPYHLVAAIANTCARAIAGGCGSTFYLSACKIPTTTETASDNCTTLIASLFDLKPIPHNLTTDDGALALYHGSKHPTP